MNSLKITSTDAKIGIQSTQGYYTMESPKGEQSITTTKPKMMVSGEAKKVIIDSYEPWAERGFKNNLDLLAETAELGRQSALNSISRIVADGNRMADIRKGTLPAIPEIAEKNSKPPMHEFNYGAIPQSKPKVTVTGGQRIDWQIGNTTIDYIPSKPQINYTRGKVETYMKQHYDIQIEYIDTRG